MPLEIRARSAASAAQALIGSLGWPIKLFVLSALAVPCLFPFSAKAQNNPAQAAEAAGLGYYANAHPYLEEPLHRLIKHIPELGTLRPARDAEESLPVILMHTGMRVHELFDNMVDLAAREEVAQQILTHQGSMMTSQRVHYNYLIVLNADTNPPRYEEYRTDGEGKRSEQAGSEQGYAITTGFALKCIYFLPALREDSTFRYLGDQMIGAKDTYVVAFAQRPAQASFWGTVTGDWGTVRILDQGIAWIDKNTFQILRLRTDLLEPHSEIGLARQTTEINFGAVQIPDVPAPLWLPSEAVVDADFQGHTFRNEHHYNEYQRFRVSVKMGEPALRPTGAESRP